MEHQQEELGTPLDSAIATPSTPTKVTIASSTTSEMADVSESQSIFFTLPPELREMVYDFALSPKRFHLGHGTRDPAILELSRQIRLEALPRFYKHTIFCFNGEYPAHDAFLWLVARPNFAIRFIIGVECVYRSARTGNARTSGRTMAEYILAYYKKDLNAAGVVLRKGVLRTVAEEATVAVLAEDDR
ncbi:hypothetical protein LTR29_006093 [Friedmanniomyces endolithicus]|nr:hypothetical protein LTR29_006093 [Friedmanniomyces endolithicus]